MKIEQSQIWVSLTRTALMPRYDRNQCKGGPVDFSRSLVLKHEWKVTKVLVANNASAFFLSTPFRNSLECPLRARPMYLCEAWDSSRSSGFSDRRWNAENPRRASMRLSLVNARVVIHFVQTCWCPIGAPGETPPKFCLENVIWT